MRDLALGKRRGCLRATSASVWLARGVALEGRSPEQAMAAYRRALAGQPGLADAHNNLGRLLHERGELAAAEHHYRQALAAEATALHWFNLGVVLEDSGHVDAAIDAYGQAIDVQAEFVEAHLNVARLLDQRGRSRDATGDLQAAVRHLTAVRRLRRTHA